MTRTELMRRINALMTSAGASLTEDQDAVLAAALGCVWEEITQSEELRTDRDRWIKIAARMVQLNRRLRETGWHITSIRCFQQEIADIEEYIIAAREKGIRHE